MWGSFSQRPKKKEKKREDVGSFIHALNGTKTELDACNRWGIMAHQGPPGPRAHSLSYTHTLGAGPGAGPGPRPASQLSTRRRVNGWPSRPPPHHHDPGTAGHVCLSVCGCLRLQTPSRVAVRSAAKQWLRSDSDLRWWKVSYASSIVPPLLPVGFAPKAKTITTSAKASIILECGNWLV